MTTVQAEIMSPEMEELQRITAALATLPEEVVEALQATMDKGEGESKLQLSINQANETAQETLKVTKALIVQNQEQTEILKAQSGKLDQLIAQSKPSHKPTSELNGSKA